MLTNGLVQFLLAQPSITSIVGSSIQPVPAPDNTSDYPVIVYQVVSYTAEYANDGPIGVSQSRIVFDCFALRYLDASTLAQAVKSALSGYTGTLPDGTRIFLIEIANIVDGFVDGSSIYRTSVHALVQFAD